MNKKLEPACFYLRKSREDQEAEARGEGETLSKHRNALLKLAKSHKVNTTKIFEEIVSGESIINRPQMLELLKEVEAGKWAAVFCMDIDRLGRGGMRDQGLILDTFKSSKTLIVTPRKIYDLNDEFDEEYTEFAAFMARKELKIITRRMQSGRKRSAEEGNFLGSVPPYGYSITQNEKKRYLIKNPNHADCIKLIFSLYTEEFGASKIAKHLNSLGYRSYTGIPWSSSSIMTILKNPVYAGIIVWGKKKETKSKTGPGKCVELRPQAEQIWSYNAHEPYITSEEFDNIQKIIKRKTHIPIPYSTKLTNPLAGLIKCSKCGKRMVYRPYGNRLPHLICYDPLCDTKSSRFDFVEKALLNNLQIWIDEYKAKILLKPLKKEKSSTKEKSLTKIVSELESLNKQKDNLHDLLERGVYDTDTFLERSAKLTERIAEMESFITSLKTEIKSENQRKNLQKNIIPKIEKVLKTYPNLTNPEKKNKLLKSILEYVEYKKDRTQKGEDFSLTLFLHLPDQ